MHRDGLSGAPVTFAASRGANLVLGGSVDLDAGYEEESGRDGSRAGCIFAAFCRERVKL